MTGPNLPVVSAPPHSYRIVITRDTMPWITANERTGWQAKARKTAQWRNVTAWRCRDLGYCIDGGAHVVVELRFHTNRRRDPGNWYATVKAVIDGLVDAGTFPDDNSLYVTGPDIRLGPPVASKSEEELIIHIFPRQGDVP